MVLLFNDFVFKRYTRNYKTLSLKGTSHANLYSTRNYKTLSLKGTSHANLDSKWENENFVQRISS
jgi:hypothetical protein